MQHFAPPASHHFGYGSSLFLPHALPLGRAAPAPRPSLLPDMDLTPPASPFRLPFVSQAMPVAPPPPARMPALLDELFAPTAFDAAMCGDLHDLLMSCEPLPLVDDMVPTPPPSQHGSPMNAVPSPPATGLLLAPASLPSPASLVMGAAPDLDATPGESKPVVARHRDSARSSPSASFDDSDDDDEMDDMPEAVQAVVTTRSGRTVRQVRYTEPSMLDLEPLPPRRRGSCGSAGSGRRRRGSSAYMVCKRDSHNISERHRRAELKTSLDDLRALVPGVQDDQRVHTATILEATIAFIRDLEDEDRTLRQQIAEQRALLQARQPPAL